MVRCGIPANTTPPLSLRRPNQSSSSSCSTALHACIRLRNTVMRRKQRASTCVGSCRWEAFGIRVRPVESDNTSHRTTPITPQHTT